MSLFFFLFFWGCILSPVPRPSPPPLPPLAPLFFFVWLRWPFVCWGLLLRLGRDLIALTLPI